MAASEADCWTQSVVEAPLVVVHLETCFFLLWHLEEEDHLVAAINWVPSVDPRLVAAYLHLVIFCLPAIASASLDHYTLGSRPG